MGVSSESVNSFVSGEATRRSSGSLNTVATGLRALLRFLHSRHYISAALVDAVPVAPSWRDRGVVRVVAADEVARMLAGCDRRKGTGRRDFAIIRCWRAWGCAGARRRPRRSTTSTGTPESWW